MQSKLRVNKKAVAAAATGPPNWNDEQDSPVLKKGETMTLLEQNAKQREEAARIASYNASVSLPPVSLPRTGLHFALSRTYQPCSEAILYLREIFELKAYSDLASSIQTIDDGRDDFILSNVNALKKSPEELKDDHLDKYGMEYMLRFPQEYFENICMDSMDRMMARLKGGKEIAFVLDPLTRKLLERVLFRAFQNKDIDIVRRVLQFDINIDSADLFGTPLMYAASWGDADHVRLLLERGAFVSSSNLHGTTSAHKAAEYGFEDVLKELISFGADVNCKDLLSTRPLHCAIHGDHADAAALLISAGADINAVDGAGFSCLHIAVAKKHLKSVCLLVQHPNLNINIRSPSGRAALHFAAEIGEEFEHLYIMEKLLEQVCDVDAQDKNKRTPLHLAMSMPHYKMASLLLKGGASVLITDNRDKTVAELITFVPGENALRQSVHEAKRRELAGEVFDKDSVSFARDSDTVGAPASTTTRRTYKEVSESEQHYIEMVREQEEVLAAFKKDATKMRLRFKEKIHDAIVNSEDRPTSASSQSSDPFRDTGSQMFLKNHGVSEAMDGTVYCRNCEQQLPSAVNIPDQLRKSLYSFCPHCGFKGPCPEFVEAIQSLNFQKVGSSNYLITNVIIRFTRIFQFSRLKLAQRSRQGSRNRAQGQMQSSFIHSTPRSARNVSDSFPFKMKCQHINVNLRFIFARIVAIRTPATDQRTWTPTSKRRGFTLQQLVHPPRILQAVASQAFILKNRHSFANIASTCLQLRQTFLLMIGHQRSPIVHIADQEILFFCECKCFITNTFEF